MSESKTLISVIVPVYKVEPYLRKCVVSIQKQTYTNLEIILIDDGSPDNCGKICDELAQGDSRIVVVHRENGGQSAARNSGLAIAKGDYIGFVDSDDYIDADMFDCLYQAQIMNKSELAVCNYRTVAEDGTILKYHSGERQVSVYTEKKAYDYLIPTLNNSVWNKLFHRDLITDIKFKEGCVHGEDFIFLLEYLKNVRTVVVIDADKYNYVRRAGSITNTRFSIKRLDEIKAKERVYSIIEQYFPAYITNAKRWCYTARINVVRCIVQAKDINRWKLILCECRSYLKQNYSSLKGVLTKSENIEAYMICHLMFAYPLILKLAFRYKQK